MKSWTGPGPHKCEWVLHSWWHPRRVRLPKFARLWLIRMGLRHRVWPFRRTIRCNEEATHIAKCDHFEGYNNLPVCAKHLKDVEKANALNEAIKDGSIDRAIREAEES